MRPDGTRVRDLTAIMQALPYVMPKRYDAQNWAEENLDEARSGTISGQSGGRGGP